MEWKNLPKDDVQALDLCYFHFCYEVNDNGSCAINNCRNRGCFIVFGS